jgi:hypothetical protein
MSRKAAKQAIIEPTKRKRGRPLAHRQCNLPRVSKKAKSLFDEIAEFRECSLARAVEIAAEVAMDAMEGRPITPEHYRYK